MEYLDNGITSFRALYDSNGDLEYKIYYYDSGQEDHSITYLIGEEISRFLYYENGQFWLEIYYPNGDIEGKKVEYDENRNVIDVDILNERGICGELCEDDD